jgi:hypothetical protein
MPQETLSPIRNLGGTLSGGGTFRVSYFYSHATQTKDPENILIGSVIADLDRKSGLPFLDQQQNDVTLVPPGSAQLDATVEPTAPKIMVTGSCFSCRSREPVGQRFS